MKTFDEFQKEKIELIVNMHIQTHFLNKVNFDEMRVYLRELYNVYKDGYNDGKRYMTQRILGDDDELESN